MPRRVVRSAKEIRKLHRGMVGLKDFWLGCHSAPEPSIGPRCQKRRDTLIVPMMSLPLIFLLISHLLVPLHSFHQSLSGGDLQDEVMGKVSILSTLESQQQS